MEMHTAKRGAWFWASQLEGCKHLHRDLCRHLLKEFILTKWSSSDGKSIQTSSTSRNFMPALTFRAANPNNSILRTDFNHSLKQRTNTPTSHTVHFPVTCFYLKKNACSKVAKIILFLLIPVCPTNSLGNWWHLPSQNILKYSNALLNKT